MIAIVIEFLFPAGPIRNYIIINPVIPNIGILSVLKGYKSIMCALMSKIESEYQIIVN